jgi:pimeloyl-ACP methyl ester carboxylesterase
METRVLDDQVRAGVKNRQFVALSDGVTAYEWGGPEDGPKVVLIHGFTSPSFIWDYTFGPLTEAGFRVLRYDLFGRGYSDRPAIAYTADVFDRQLEELLQSQGVTEPVSLVGLSMGGAITIHFTDRHPERVARFALMAPAGFPIGDIPLKYRVLASPYVGEWIMKAFGDRVMLSSLATQVTSDPEKAQQFKRAYLEQMQYKGYKNAILSTLRHNPLLELEPVYRRVGQLQKPCMLFWGTNDNVVPYAHHERAQAAIPSIRFHSVPEGSHIANYELPDEVNPVLISFLREGAPLVVPEAEPGALAAGLIR